MTKDEYLKAIRLCAYGHHKVRQNKYGFFVLVELDSIGLYPHIYNGKLDYKGDYYLSYESALEEGLLMALRYL